MNKALLTGINEFADPSANLRGCVNDVLDMRELLVSQFAFDPRNIRLLCNQRATRAAIYERIQWALKDLRAGDNVVIDFSTHGSQLADRDGDELDDKLDEVLIPHDFPDLWDDMAHDGYTEYGAQIPDDALGNFLRVVPEEADCAVIVDACHSGSSTRALNPHYRKARAILPPIDIRARSMGINMPVRQFGVKPAVGWGKGQGIVEYNPNVHIINQRHILLSGCRDTQTSDDATFDNDRPNGAMSYAFFQVLEQNGWDLTWLEVHSKMIVWLADHGFAQVPQLSGPLHRLEKKVFGGKAS